MKQTSNAMATVTGAYVKELYRLIRTIDTLTCGQARVDLTCDDETEFHLYITPNDGCYKGATCKFKVCVPDTYPAEAPIVTCLNAIYHPNIDIYPPESAVCVNLLQNDWEPAVGLDGCVMAVLYLFHNPNPEDALSPVFDGAPMDEHEFMENVRTSLRGGVVEGYTFDQLIKDNEQNNEMNNNLNEEQNTCTNYNEQNNEMNEEQNTCTNYNEQNNEMNDNLNEEQNTCKNYNEQNNEMNDNLNEEQNTCTNYNEQNNEMTENLNEVHKIDNEIVNEIERENEKIQEKQDELNEDFTMQENNLGDKVEKAVICLMDDKNANTTLDINNLFSNIQIQNQTKIKDEGIYKQDQMMCDVAVVKEQTGQIKVLQTLKHPKLYMASLYSKIWHRTLRLFQRFFWQLKKLQRNYVPDSKS